jgi:tRNA(His) 5'-end guanylyltransferase
VHQNLVDACHLFFTNLRPETIYVCSDEISLVFRERDSLANVPFSGRVQKLASVASSQYTIEFHKKMVQSLPFYESHANYEKIHKTITQGVCFDARVFSVDDHDAILENILWRSRYDCVRNSKNSLGQTIFRQKDLMGVNSDQVVIKLREEKGIDWNLQPSEYKFGSFLKREKYLKEGTDGKSGKSVLVERNRIQNYSFLLDHNEKSKKFLISEFYEE